jgi:hypothetical protein
MNKHILALASLMAVSASSSFAFTHVTANIVADEQWTTVGSPYILEGVIYVKNNATLDIAPGVVIRGQPKFNDTATDPGALIITKGSKIQARGTSSSPIIFTTAVLDAGRVAAAPADLAAAKLVGTGARYNVNGDATPDRWTSANGEFQFLDIDPAVTPLAPNSNGLRNSALWGSLVLLGNAKINASTDILPIDGIEVEGQYYLEGLNSTNDNVYGGTNDDDSSGFLNYVSLRHGGYEITSGKELNGITLAGVGRGTTVRNVEVYCNSDDGIEIFGGTVNVTYAIMTFCEDDGYDLDQGYRGTSQFIYVAHGLKATGANPLSSDPRGSEVDGDDANDGAAFVTSDGQPFQNSVIYNATFQVMATNTPAVEGVRIRRGFRGEFVNSIVQTSAAEGTTGMNIDSTAAVAPSPFVRQSYADRLLAIRNTTINGFTTASSSFTATPSLSSVPNFNVSTSFNPSTNAGTTGFTGLQGALFPATANSVATADMLSISYVASGLNPRPGAGPGTPSGLATGTTQAESYVKYPAVPTTYRGAFNGTAATLWTTGWTAVNKVNTDGIKLLVD